LTKHEDYRERAVSRRQAQREECAPRGDPRCARRPAAATRRSESSRAARALRPPTGAQRARCSRRSRDDCAPCRWRGPAPRSLWTAWPRRRSCSQRARSRRRRRLRRWRRPLRPRSPRPSQEPSAASPSSSPEGLRPVGCHLGNGLSQGDRHADARRPLTRSPTPRRETA
jgi:hypothetical protein